MTSNIENVCRLCLKVCPDIECIEDTLYESLTTLPPSFNLNLTQNAMVCKDCTMNIKKFLIYKTASLNLKDTMKDLKSTSVDLCLFCTRKMDVNSLIRLSSKITSVVVLKMTMEQCFPELDLQANADLILICIWCAKNIQKNFDFIVNCLKVEHQVKEFKKKIGTTEGQIDLKGVLNYVQKIADSKKDDIKENCDSGLAVIKEDCLENEENNEVYLQIKIEDIKTEPYYEDLDVDVNKIKSEYGNEFNLKTEPAEYEEETWSNYDGNPTSENCEYKDIAENIKIEINDYSYEMAANNTLSPPELADMNVEGSHSNEPPKQYRPKRKRVHKNTNEMPMHQCLHCAFRSKYKQALAKHTITHTGKPNLHKCSLCNFKTKRLNNLHQHLESHERKVAIYQSYQPLNKTPAHKKNREEILSSCHLCPFQTNSPTYLHEHMLVHKKSSAKVMIYKCDRCDFHSKYKVCVNLHQFRTHRSEVTKHECSCGYEAKNSSDLAVHMLVHKKDMQATMYKCGSCSFETKYKSYLGKHAERTHKSAE